MKVNNFANLMIDVTFMSWFYCANKIVTGGKRVNNHVNKFKYLDKGINSASMQNQY